MNVTAKGRIIEVCPVERRETKNGEVREVHKYVAILDQNGRPEYWKFEVRQKDVTTFNLQEGGEYHFSFGVDFRPYTRHDASGIDLQDYFCSVTCWSAIDPNHPTFSRQ